MRENRCIFIVPIIFLMVCIILLVGPVPYAYSSTVTLTWDANSEPDISGYRLFSRQEGENYDYSNPAWEGPETTCTVQVTDGTDWYFVVRAVNTSGYESDNSNVVVYQPTTQDTDGDGLFDADETSIYGTDPDIKDTDGDGINDGIELNYWGANWDVDYDGDGLNNLLDPDADNDEALDGLEIEDGFDPSDPTSHPQSGNNQQPLSDAGPDQLVDENVLVNLNGSNSTDPDDGIASYMWTQSGGTPVTLSDPAAVQPAFTAPDVGIHGASLTFELTVTDNGGLQSTDTCIVTVNVAVVQDSDGDGLSDSLENTTSTNPYDADTDDDGILDGWEDANHDGTVDTNETDPCNTDTDGDGVQDGTELGYTLENIGLDTDMGIFQPDFDPLSLTNPLNSDTDGDNVIDGEEDLNHNGRVDAGETDPTNEPTIDDGDTVIITMVAYNNGLAVDFGSSDLYYYNGASWSQISTNNPEWLTTYNDNLAADFGTYGLYSYNGSAWSQISTSDADK